MHFRITLLGGLPDGFVVVDFGQIYTDVHCGVSGYQVMVTDQLWLASLLTLLNLTLLNFQREVKSKQLNTNRTKAKS